MKPMTPMTAGQVEAIYAYGQALLEGRAELPDGIHTLGPGLEASIKNAIAMHELFGETDYGSVDELRQGMLVVSRRMFEAAMRYQPSARYLT